MFFNVPDFASYGSKEGCYDVTVAPHLRSGRGPDLFQKSQDYLKMVQANTHTREVTKPSELFLTSDCRCFGTYQYEHWPFINMANRLHSQLGRVLCDASYGMSSDQSQAKQMTLEPPKVAGIFNSMLGMLDQEDLPLYVVVNEITRTVQGVSLYDQPRSLLRTFSDQYEVLRKNKLTPQRMQMLGPCMIVDSEFDDFQPVGEFRFGVTFTADVTREYIGNTVSYCFLRSDGARLLVPDNVDHRVTRAAAKSPLQLLLRTPKKTAVLYKDGSRALTEAAVKSLSESVSTEDKLGKAIDAVLRKKRSPKFMANSLKLVLREIAGQRDIANMATALRRVTILDLFNGWLDVAMSQSVVSRLKLEDAAWPLLLISNPT